MHLGFAFSERLRRSPGYIANLESCWRAPLLLPSLHFDGARNVEIMRPSSLFQKFFGTKSLNIVGCNFSAFRDDLIKVNGYDEELTGVGGEDDDLHWRLEASGISVKNFKFQAIVYHLYHKPRRNEATANISRSKENLLAGIIVAKQGIDAHLDCRKVRNESGRL
jgi:predicted glycosyltransferase involved in capsule biosynthesis